MTRNDLITDRTAADIDMALALVRQNLPLPPDNLRIAWDWRALQRIETFSRYLADLWVALGYSIPTPITTKENWTTETINSEAESSRVLNNLRALRNLFSDVTFPVEIPETPNNLTTAQANDIEKVLFVIDELLEHMALSWFQLGEVMSGEV